MKKLLFLLVLTVISSSVVRADNYNDGIKAYEKKDYATALKLWRPLAIKGDVSAQSILGLMYQDGQGVKRDYKEAIKWYEKAAEQGDVSAQFNLALMYDNGKDCVNQDYRKQSNIMD